MTASRSTQGVYLLHAATTIASGAYMAGSGATTVSEITGLRGGNIAAAVGNLVVVDEIVLICASLGWGWAIDHFGTRPVASLGLILKAASMVLTALLATTLPGLYFARAFYAVHLFPFLQSWIKKADRSVDRLRSDNHLCNSNFGSAQREHTLRGQAS